MTDALSKIRDLLIVAGIYLYFIAWVYVHFYYGQFGIPTEELKIDYSTYLVYSYNVLISERFLLRLLVLLIVVLLMVVSYRIIYVYRERNSFCKKSYQALRQNALAKLFLPLANKHSLILIIAFLVLLFPFVFRMARLIAIDDYRHDRMDTRSLKTIQFIFRKDVELMSPFINLDSSLGKKEIFYRDISIIKNDKDQVLRLLGESDNYYIVLNQHPYDTALKTLPTGYVYFIDKKDVLLSKVTLRSF